MKCIEELLNSPVDKKIGNYKIQYIESRLALITMYDQPIAKVFFGDNTGKGGYVVVGNTETGMSVTRPTNSIIRTLHARGFKII